MYLIKSKSNTKWTSASVVRKLFLNRRITSSTLICAIF